MAAANLRTIQITATFAGHPYQGPAVVVRDIALVRQATDLLVGQAMTEDPPAASLTIIPLLKSVPYA